MLYQVYLAWMKFELKTLVLICTNCTGSCKANYQTITTRTPLNSKKKKQTKQNKKTQTMVHKHYTENYKVSKANPI
jgi:hypothetical protein